jgi:hypothetical protein
LAWPISTALIVLGTCGLIGAMLLVAAADRKPATVASSAAR